MRSFRLGGGIDAFFSTLTSTIDSRMLRLTLDCRTGKIELRRRSYLRVWSNDASKAARSKSSNMIWCMRVSTQLSAGHTPTLFNTQMQMMLCLVLLLRCSITSIIYLTAKQHTAKACSIQIRCSIARDAPNESSVPALGPDPARRTQLNRCRVAQEGDLAGSRSRLRQALGQQHSGL